MTSPREVFAGLAGRWELSRSIEPGLGSATGTAVFTPDGDGRLRYREDVRLVLATGHVGPAFREYTYVLDGDVLRILLTDGTVMHSLALDDSLTAADIHPCRADSYEGTYRFAAGTLTVDMRVTGPAKDYRLHTDYTRVTPSGQR